MKDFIPYEEALALKELGFDEECLDGYNKYGKLWGMRFDNQSTVNDACSAPLFSQAFRWFKQNHKLKFYIREDIWNEGCYVHILMQDEYENVGAYSTYEEAELACLKKLIKLVKQK
jgi:hypothetical protein